MGGLKRCTKCGDRKSPDDFHMDSSRDDGRYPVCKPCRKPLSNASYVKNSVGIAARTKVRMAGKYGAISKKRRENPEYVEYLKTYLKQYYLDRPEKWAGVYWTKPEVLRRRARVYRATNPAKVRASVQAWRRRNPDAIALAHHKRKAALAVVEDTLTPEQLGEILVYFDFRCGFCLVDLRTLPKFQRTWDHLLPVSRGGTNTADNVVPCCKTCNSRKKDRHIALMASYIPPSLGIAIPLVSHGN
jgi:5-methylcytosine-specific restriction endonuclease McrA